ncbi:MAG: lysophospholipid acyltransferase family protein [Verrucomicrobiota bacterium]|nr:lysophospholipid acyltransferase family protein [Verrucomicrobiota bacterium]
MKALWKRIRYRLEWLALTAALWLVPWLSRDACYRLAGFAGRLASGLDRAGRRVALSNLEAAFGDEYSPVRREEIVRESYEHFARTMLDLFWSPRLNRENFARYIEFRNDGESSSGSGSPGNCILGGFHYGNFEWMGLALSWLGFPSAVITQEFKNPLLDGFFQRLREQSGHQTVPRAGAIVRLFKALRKGDRVALLVDTTLPPHHPTVVIECFGLKTIVTVAHAWLQERTGVPIVPVYCEALPHGRFRVVTLPPVRPAKGATHQEIAQACWDAFEPVIRSNPAPWLWMYKHWRYKPPAAARPYPFYAQESLEFDQIAGRPDYAKLDRVPIQIARGRIPDPSREAAKHSG